MFRSMLDPFIRETTFDADLGDGGTGDGVTDDLSASEAGADEAAASEAARSDGADASSTPAWLSSEEDFSRAVAAQTEQQLTRILEAAAEEQARAEAAATGNQPIELNPLADNFGDQLQQVLAREIQKALEPLMPVVEHSQSQQADAWAAQQLAAIEEAKLFDLADEGRLTDGDKQAILFLASGVNQAAGGRDPNGAMRQGAELLAARDKQVAQAAVERYKQHLDIVGSAPNDRGAGSEGVEHTEPPKDEIEAALRYAQRHRL